MSDDTSEPNNAKPQDLLARLKQMAEPIVSTIDNRLSGQVDKRVDKRVEESFTAAATAVALVKKLQKAAKVAEEAALPEDPQKGQAMI